MSRFYSREHYRRVSGAVDTPREIALRALDTEARAKATSDADEKFGRVPPSDAATIIEKYRYWESRVGYWRDALGAWG